MFDILSRAAADTFEFQLCDGDDTPLTFEGKPCMAVVYGPGSKPYVAATGRRQARTMARIQKGKDINVSPEDSTRQGAEFLADITVSLDLAYEGLEGREKLVAIFSDTRLGFIADQVARKSSDWANFTKGSAKS